MKSYTHKKSIGQTGENIAIKFLKSKGFKIIEKNFKCKIGEIDIIAKDGDILVFIEVKTRSSNFLKPPYHNVTGKKEKKILRIADYYLYKTKTRNTRTRFDVISIVIQDPVPEIKYFRAAFGNWKDGY